MAALNHSEHSGSTRQLGPTPCDSPFDTAYNRPASTSILLRRRRFCVGELPGHPYTVAWLLQPSPQPNNSRRYDIRHNTDRYETHAMQGRRPEGTQCQRRWVTSTTALISRAEWSPCANPSITLYTQVEVSERVDYDVM